MPQPITTQRARLGKSLMVRGSWVLRGGSEDDADGLLEAVDVAQHGGFGRVAVAVADRLEQLPVLAHGIAELLDAVEGEEPDPQAEQVVLAERGREERVVRAPVDVPVDALVELDQAPLVAVGLR